MGENVVQQAIPYVLSLIVAVTISAALAIFAWHRCPAPGARSSVWLMLAVAEWSLAYALELGSAGLPVKLFWVKIEYLGVVQGRLFRTLVQA